MRNNGLITEVVLTKTSARHLLNIVQSYSPEVNKIKVLQYYDGLIPPSWLRDDTVYLMLEEGNTLEATECDIIKLLYGPTVLKRLAFKHGYPIGAPLKVKIACEGDKGNMVIDPCMLSERVDMHYRFRLPHDSLLDHNFGYLLGNRSLLQSLRIYFRKKRFGNF